MVIHINCLKLGWSNKLFLQTKSFKGQSFTYLQGDPKSDHDPDLGVHFLPVWYNGWWREAVILRLVVEGLAWRLWSSLGEFLVVTARAQGIVLSKRCSLSCLLLIDRYAPLPCTCPNWNPSHKDLLTFCVPKIWSQLIVQQSTIVRDCCTIGLAAGRFLLSSASKRLHVGRGGGNHKKGLTSLPNTFKERGEGLWTSGQSRTH